MTAQPTDLRRLTAAEYDVLAAPDDVRDELQEGVRVMMSPPSPDHQDCGSVLWAQLRAQLAPEFKVLQEVGVDLELAPPDRPGTVRVPDLVVVTRKAFGRVRIERGFLRASEVLLAVEVLSPGSERRDTRIKHAEYADAGIGHYWMIDLEDGPSLVAGHLAGTFGYLNSEPVRGRFTATDPVHVEIDLDALVDRI